MAGSKKTFAERIRDIQDHVTLPGQLVLEIRKSGGEWMLWVFAPHGVNNETGAMMQWISRKWRLSEHMTDGEIVQTALLATLTAVEHEIRETFLYKGFDIFNPHYDLDGLVKLRASSALEIREPIP